VQKLLGELKPYDRILKTLDKLPRWAWLVTLAEKTPKFYSEVEAALKGLERSGQAVARPAGGVSINTGVTGAGLPTPPTHREERMLSRQERGIGLRERGGGICFKMLDHLATMSPREREQLGGVANVAGCTPEGVRRWKERNALKAAELAEQEFLNRQEIEKARHDLQALRGTCYETPEWVRRRLVDHPQKPVGLHLGQAGAPLPVPFTRDEVLDAVRDVLSAGGLVRSSAEAFKGSSRGTWGQCAGVDPASVAVSRILADVLVRWFDAWGWIRIQVPEGATWWNAHLPSRIERLFRDPFSPGQDPPRRGYETPLELGPYFSTTMDAQARLAAMPESWTGVIRLGPGAALAEGRITEQEYAQMMRGRPPVPGYGPPRPDTAPHAEHDAPGGEARSDELWGAM